VYGGGVVGGEDNKGGRVGGGDCYLKSTYSISNLLSNSYSELDIFLCKS